MRLPRSLAWRIALAYTVLIVLSMVGASIYIVLVVRDRHMTDLEVRLHHEAALVAQASQPYFQGEADPRLGQEAQRLGSLIAARVTLISPEGTVLADTWDGHSLSEEILVGPEVRDALAGFVGRSTRFSPAAGREALYTAVPVYAEGVLAGVARVSVSTAQVQANVNRMIATVALAGLAVTVLAVVLGYFMARRTSRSVRSVTEGARLLAQGDLDHRVQALAEDETMELADTFNLMAGTLKATIQEAQTERNRLSAVLETMGDGVVMLGPEGEVVLINQVARGLLGVGATAALGRRLIELARHHELQMLVSRSLETAEPQFGEIEIHPQGFLSAIAVPLLDQGASAGVLLTLHDLTRVRQLDTTRREFVSNVSHELRNPLAAIKASVETLEDGAMAEPQVAREFVRRIHEDVDRMTAMTSDLLELSRLESGQIPLHLYPLDIEGLMDSVVAGVNGHAESKGVSVSVAHSETLPPALGDGDKLRQVLVNLVDNALKFTPNGGSATLTAVPTSRFLEVRVADTGIGIPREHLPHVFERFYKVDRSRGDGGTGLGLAIVKHIVQAHGGDVKAESREDVGSTFSFTVPRAD